MDEQVSMILEDYDRRVERIWADHLKHRNSSMDAIERGENINVKGARGNTAVHIASNDVLNPQLMRNFLRYAPNFNIQNQWQQTPLHFYMKKIFLQSPMLESILEKRADPNLPDADGNTCLHYLAKHPLKGFINLKLLTHTLLKYNAKVNIVNRFGETPLHLAVEHGAMDFITALLHTEASVLIKNNENMTALDMAYTDRNDKPEVFNEMVKFAIILNNCRIPVNKKFLDQAHSNESLRIFNDECNEELSRLKKIRVCNTNVTLDVILKLSTHAIAKYLRNSEILEWFRNFESEQYKIFGNRINQHFKEGLERKEAEENAYFFCRNILQTLPADCHYIILSYLSNEDLHNLKWIRRNEIEVLHINDIPAD